jgi:hypothetical protein
MHQLDFSSLIHFLNVIHCSITFLCNPSPAADIFFVQIVRFVRLGAQAELRMRLKCEITTKYKYISYSRFSLISSGNRTSLLELLDNDLVKVSSNVIQATSIDTVRAY